MSSIDSLKLVSALMEAEDRHQAFVDVEWAIRRIGELESGLLNLLGQVDQAHDAIGVTRSHTMQEAIAVANVLLGREPNPEPITDN